MSLALDPSASKAFLAKGLTDSKLKKEAVKLADRVASLFLLHITASELCEEKKKKTIDKDDVMKALKDNGFEEYITTLQRSLEQSEEDMEDQSGDSTPTRKKPDHEKTEAGNLSKHKKE